MPVLEATTVRPEPGEYPEDDWAALAIENLPHLIWMVNDDGRLIHTCRRFQSRIGLKRGCIAPWSAMLSDDDAWKFQTAWNQARVDGGTVVMDALVRDATGELCREYALRLRPGDDGSGGRIWYGTLTDNRDRRDIGREIQGTNNRLETRLSCHGDRSKHAPPLGSTSASSERIRRRSELMTEILDGMVEAVVVAAADGTVMLNNAAASELFGKALSVRIHDWTDLAFEHDSAAASPCVESAALLQSALQGIETTDRRLTARGTDDAPRWFDARALPLFGEGDHIRGAVGVFREVTERLRMERRIGQLERLEAIGRLSAGIAHEINTPIQYVGDNLRFLGEACRALINGTGGTETLDRDFLAAEIPVTIAQSLEGIDRVAAVVRAMRDFAAPGPDEPVVVCANQLIENVSAVTRNEWKYDATIEFDLDPDLPQVPGHARELNQALYHLLMNSVDAIRSAGRPGRINIATRRADDCIEMKITDNGCGIPDAMRDRVFDPFFTTKTPGRHTGEGLTFVLAVVVKRHHGAVELASDFGVGTSVTLRLPLEWPARPEANP